MVKFQERQEGLVGLGQTRQKRVRVTRKLYNRIKLQRFKAEKGTYQELTQGHDDWKTFDVLAFV